MVNLSFLHSAVKMSFALTQKYMDTTVKLRKIKMLPPIKNTNLSPKPDILKISVMGDKMNVTSPKMLTQVVRDARNNVSCPNLKPLKV